MNTQSPVVDLHFKFIGKAIITVNDTNSLSEKTNEQSSENRNLINKKIEYKMQTEYNEFVVLCIVLFIKKSQK